MAAGNSLWEVPSLEVQEWAPATFRLSGQATELITCTLAQVS